MKKTFLLLLVLGSLISVHAQKDSTKTAKKKGSFDLSNRSADHVMVQYGSDTWLNRPDSINTKGFSRHFNAYIMYDQAFKNSPKFSAALGIGLGTSNMFFEDTYVDIKANSTTLPFRPTATSGVNRFKKFKVTTIFLEAPIEIRYFDKPDNTNKSWKAALGVKVGTLIKSYTKGKNMLDAEGNSIYGQGYKVKESSKRFFTGTRLAATARVGYGIYGLHFGYEITPTIKDGFGPGVRTMSIGLTISGL